MLELRGTRDTLGHDFRIRFADGSCAHLQIGAKAVTLGREAGMDVTELEARLALYEAGKAFSLPSASPSKER